VKLPKREREEPQPPSGEHLLAILDAMGEKWRLLFVVIEQGALRLGEAVNLRWADVDPAGSRLRLPRSATKRGPGPLGATPAVADGGARADVPA
jgi:integrase